MSTTPTRHAVVDTTLGELTVTAEGAGDAAALTGVYFPHHWHPPTAARLGARVEEEADPLLAEAAAQLRAYLAGARDRFDLPTATHGNPFSETVWAILRGIPRGATTTYGAIAAELGDRALAQRVGQAVGRNPLSIVVPCHRVLGAGGAITGYAGGLDRKRALLALELPVPEGALF